MEPSICRTCGRGNPDFPAKMVASAILFLLLYFFTGPNLRCQQVSVEVRADVPLIPGSWSRVDIEVTGAAGSGPARLQQDFPVGFSFRPVELAGGTFFQQGTTVNFLWSAVPPGRTMKIAYEVLPDRSTEGAAIDVAGWFYRVTDRITSVLSPMKIKVGSETGDRARETVTTDTPAEGLVFRVQLLSSSSRLSDQELEKRLGVSFREKVTVVKAGKIYKYQVGDCTTYECALALLEKFRSAGVEGAFMVAWLDGSQITIENARSRGR